MEEIQHEFFAAVRGNDVAKASTLLREDSRLVEARCAGDNRLLGVVWNERSSADPVPPGDPRSCTPLHHAAYNGMAEMIELLLEHGADPNAIGYDNNRRNVTPLILAAAEGNLETVRALLAHGADPNFVNEIGCSAIETALDENGLDKAMLLIERGGVPTVHSAAMLGLVDRVRELLTQNPALVHEADRKGRMPLDAAAVWNERAVAEVLIQQGARVTPRSAAALGRIVDLKRFLAAEPDLIRSGHLLTHASITGQVQTVAYLLSQGADPNELDSDRATPLHNVAMSMARPQCAESIEPLLKAGADPDFIHRGHTPLARARQADNQAVVDALLSHGITH